MSISNEELDDALNVLESLENIIVIIGTEMLRNLTEEQKEVVIRKLSDEFRFWRLK
jgi:hypothetical protein